MTTSLTPNFRHIFYCLFSHLQRLKSLCVHSFVIVFILSSPPVSEQTRSWRLRQDHLLCNSRSQSRRWSPGAHRCENDLSSLYLHLPGRWRARWGNKIHPGTCHYPWCLVGHLASNWAEPFITFHFTSGFTYFIHFAISIERQKG